MNFIKKSLCILMLFIFLLPCFADNADVPVTIIEKENYRIQIKQYKEDYPVALYVIFKEYTPTTEAIRKILRTELLLLSKKEGLNNNIIASAWFDDQISDNLYKIELSKNYSAFVWVSGEEKKIMTFPEYLKFLKKKKEEDKNKGKINKEKVNQ